MCECVCCATPSCYYRSVRLNACASRGLSLLHNTASAAEDAGERDRDPPRARLGGSEVRKCPWVLSFRDVAPSGVEEEEEGEEGFFQRFLTLSSDLNASPWKGLQEVVLSRRNAFRRRRPGEWARDPRGCRGERGSHGATAGTGQATGSGAGMEETRGVSR